jgi:hypothetical protein
VPDEPTVERRLTLFAASANARIGPARGIEDDACSSRPLIISRVRRRADGDADSSAVGGQGPPAEAGSLEHELILGGEVLDGHVATPDREHPVIPGDADAIAGAGGERVDRLLARREDARDQMGLAIGADDPDRPVDQ